MTLDEVEDFLRHCPTLFHMAERGSWPSIKDRGLLSTSALLDLYEITYPQRSTIERCHRPESVLLEGVDLPGAVVRDQKPMSDSGLRRCLPAHLSPEDWYRILNSKVFFWTSLEKLHKLTCARAYRDKEHDVLEIDARRIMEDYWNNVWLCPYNSGATKPNPFPRDEGIFSRIEEYAYHGWRAKRKRVNAVVEVAIDYGVPNIADYVTRVVVKKGSDVLAVI